MAYRPITGISLGKKDQVAGPGFLPRHNSTLVINPGRRGARQVIYPGLGVNPAHKTAAVKRGLGRRASPHIRETQILFAFGTGFGAGLRVGAFLGTGLGAGFDVFLGVGAFLGIGLGVGVFLGTGLRVGVFLGTGLGAGFVSGKLDPEKAAAGVASPEIARRLNISHDAVRQDLSAVYRILIPDATSSDDRRTRAVLAYLAIIHDDHAIDGP